MHLNLSLGNNGYSFKKCFFKLHKNSLLYRRFTLFFSLSHVAVLILRARRNDGSVFLKMMMDLECGLWILDGHSDETGL
jgi:hypothetical protein